MKPKALDLFCGAGGMSAGLVAAGYDVTGVDITPQPHYPFRFHQADALTFPLDSFDLICASPPCQAFTSLHRVHKRVHPNLIPAIRARLCAWGGPYLIENVAGAAKHLHSPVMLCGTMFGLKVYRHRLFESNCLIGAPMHHTPHQDKTPRVGHCGTSPKGFITVAGHIGMTAYARQAMEIDWMTRDELAQAIPPAYSQYLGEQIKPYLRRSAA